MCFTEIVDQIKFMNEELETLEREFQEKLQASFKKLISVFFEDTGVQAIAWTQYTPYFPYFNSGDPCEFRVNDPVFIFKNFDVDDILDHHEYEGESEHYGVIDEYESYAFHRAKTNVDLYNEGKPPVWYNDSHYQSDLQEIAKFESKDGDIVKACGEFASLIKKNDSVMKNTYGDHVQVVLTKDNAYVTEYDHD